MKINEENLFEKVEEEIRTGKKINQIYLDVKNKVNNLNTYDSMKSNLDGLFIYYFVDKKLDIKDFEKFLNSSIYETSLRRFFKFDTEYSLKKAIKCGSIWDKMNYLFFTQDKNKLIPNKENLKYFEAIILNAKEKNQTSEEYRDTLLAFYSSRVEEYMVLLAEKETDFFLELMKKAEKINDLSIEKHKMYSNIFSNFISSLANKSYEDSGISISKIKKIYKSVKNETWFEKWFYNDLFTDKLSNKKKSNLTLAKLLTTADKDFFNIFDEKYKNEIEQLTGKKRVKFSEDIPSFLSVCVFKEKLFNIVEFNEEKINKEKDFIYNIFQIKLLEELINKNKIEKINISNETLNYIINFQKETNEKYDAYNNNKNKILDENMHEVFENKNMLDEKTIHKLIKIKEYKETVK